MVAEYRLLRFRGHPYLFSFNGQIEAGWSVGVASGSGLFDQKQDGIPVAIQA